MGPGPGRGQISPGRPPVRPHRLRYPTKSLCFGAIIANYSIKGFLCEGNYPKCFQVLKPKEVDAIFQVEFCVPGRL